jgi:hypothetical protein
MNISPLLFLFYSSKGSERVRYAGDRVEMGYTPSGLGINENITKKSTQKEDLLKKIESQFNLTSTSTSSPAFSLILDENFFNFFIIPLITTEAKYSIREFMEGNPKMALFSQMMTIKTISMLVPSFKEGFTENTRIDLLATLNHNTILEGIENAEPTGISFDKDGNFKANVNIAAKVIAEKGDGEWVNARSMYITVSLKGAAVILNPHELNATLTLFPQSLDLSTLKIYKGEDEQFLEQMMI